ncbi:MAG: hypothetical protein AVDCRST_MAG32-2, partial [uncultured Nocardioides sp.]
DGKARGGTARAVRHACRGAGPPRPRCRPAPRRRRGGRPAPPQGPGGAAGPPPRTPRLDRRRRAGATEPRRPLHQHAGGPRLGAAHRGGDGVGVRARHLLVARRLGMARRAPQLARVSRHRGGGLRRAGRARRHDVRRPCRVPRPRPGGPGPGPGPPRRQVSRQVRRRARVAPVRRRGPHGRTRSVPAAPGRRRAGRRPRRARRPPRRQPLPALALPRRGRDPPRRVAGPARRRTRRTGPRAGAGRIAPGQPRPPAHGAGPGAHARRRTPPPGPARTTRAGRGQGPDRAPM